MRDDKLIRIPLQFFGETEDDFEDEFEDEFDDEYEDYSDEEDDEADEDGAEEGNAENAEGEESAADASSEDPSDHSDLIADLKALGFKGDNLDAIKASVRARREAREKGAAAEERRAAQAEGAAHIKGSKPDRSASGDALEGFTARDIAEVNACLRNPTKGKKGRARAALERAVRAK